MRAGRGVSCGDSTQCPMPNAQCPPPTTHCPPPTTRCCRTCAVTGSGERDRMAEQSISCPSCGKKMPLTRALRADIEASLRLEFTEELHRAQEDGARQAEKKL